MDVDVGIDAVVDALVDADALVPGDAGLLLATDDPAQPWVTIGGNGNIVFFSADPGSGRPSGLTVLHHDGRVGVLAVDPVSAMPTHWVSAGYVWTFSNVRPEQGLVDVGLIAPNGETGQFLDLHVPPQPLPRPGLNMDTGGTGKVEEFLTTLGVGVNLTICAGSTILSTGAAVVGTLSFPPAAIPLFETSAGATAAACAGAFIALMALRPENTTAVKVNDAIEGIQGTIEDGDAAGELFEQVVECAQQRSPWECLQAAYQTAAFVSNETVRSVLDAYIRLRDGEARSDVPYTVYCCGGPTQVAVGDLETWRASVVEGLGRLPFTYKWVFGDEAGETWINSDQYALTQMHRFARPGVFSLHVSVRDAAGNEVRSNATAVGPLSTFYVEAYEPLGLECCESPRYVEPGGRLLIDVRIIGGRPPFGVKLDAGDGGTSSGFVIARNDVKLPYTWVDEGEYQFRVRVTDADGTTVSSSPQTIVVGFSSPPTDVVDVVEVVDTVEVLDTTPAEVVDTVAAEVTPVEWVVWRPTTVGCWNAPHVYVGTMTDYEKPQAYCNTPYGGLDCSAYIDKTLMQGGFADPVEATAWVCAQLTCFYYHDWCPPHYLMAGGEVLAQHLGCDVPQCQ